MIADCSSGNQNSGEGALGTPTEVGADERGISLKVAPSTGESEIMLSAGFIKFIDSWCEPVG